MNERTRPSSTPSGSGSGVPFGRYLIRRRLGRGGMGEVFLAEQLGPLGPVRSVALKRMLPELKREPRALERFLHEMSVVAQLNHPNIATTYDFGEVDGVYFIAMELIEGVTLDQLVHSGGPISLVSALLITKGVAEALAFAHGIENTRSNAPVVHQDVSPQNVMISTRGAVKLLDFGIARIEASSEERMRGKLAYLAPERLRGAATDRRSDLWALGVLLYECLTARCPFPSHDAAELLDAAESRTYTPLAELRPDAARLEPILAHLLKPEPAQRLGSAAAVANACAEMLAQEAPPSALDALSALVVAASAAPPSAKTSGVERTLTGVGPEPSPSVEGDAKRATTRSRSAFARAISSALGLGVLMLTLAVFGGRWISSGATPVPSAPSHAPSESRVSTERFARSTTASALSESRVSTERFARSATASAPPESRVSAERFARSATASAAVTTTPKRRKTRVSGPQPAKEAIPAQPGLGVLSVRTTPWAKVVLDGKSLGEGVVAARPVPSGLHTLTLQPGDARFAPKAVALTIRVGATTKVFVDFESDTVRVDPP